MTTITANDINARGISSIEEQLANASEAIISVHGQERYVVIQLEYYHKLQELEIERAWINAKADLEAGRYQKDSIDEHIKRISA